MTTPTPTASAKEQVLAWVRSKNPQTMKLKFGCKFRWNYDTYMVNCGGNCFPRQHILAFSCTGDSHYWADNPSDAQKETRKYFSQSQEWLEENKEYIEILGSDMGLQELLIALKDIPLNIGMYTTGRLRISNISCIHGAGNETCVFDLTKNLHNQDDSFYEALLPIIK